METMFNAPVTSLVTHLIVPISSTDTTISLASMAGIMPAPNIIVITDDTTNDAETIHYTGVAGYTLTGCTRGFGNDGILGIARAWGVTADVFPAYTGLAHNAFKTNIETLRSDLDNATENLSDILELITPRNLIINPGFTINQRLYVSGTELASGTYGHDRWKAGSLGCAYTFTQLDCNTEITIPAGDSLRQVIEGKNVQGSHLTLSWEGTAAARLSPNTAAPTGGFFYSVSPLTVYTQTPGAPVTIEFTNGTLKNPNLTESNFEMPIETRSYQEERILCQSQCYLFDGDGGGITFFYGLGTQYGTNQLRFFFTFPVRMRDGIAIVFSSSNPTLTAVVESSDNKIQVDNLSAGGTAITTDGTVSLSANLSSKHGALLIISTTTTFSGTSGDVLEARMGGPVRLLWDGDI